MNVVICGLLSVAVLWFGKPDKGKKEAKPEEKPVAETVEKATKQPAEEKVEEKTAETTKKVEEETTEKEKNVVAVEKKLAEPEEAEKPVDIGALKKEVKALQNKQRGLDKKLRDIRGRIRKSGELAEEREALARVEKEYKEKSAKDPAIVEAQAALKGAEDEVKKAIEDELAREGKYATAKKELLKLDEKKKDLEWQRRLAEFKLRDRSSPITRKLEDDVELRELRDLAAKTRGNSKEWKAYHKAREEKLATLPGAAQLLEQIKSAQTERQEVDKAYAAARNKPRELWQAVERGKSPAVVAAKEKRNEAYNAIRKIQAEALADVTEARNSAARAYEIKVKELLEADKEGGAVIAELQDLKTKVDELSKKIHEAAKKKTRKQVKK